MIKSNIIINPDIQIYIYDRTLNIDPAEPSVIVTPGIKLSRPYMKICDGVPKEIDVRFRVIGFSLSCENDDDIDIIVDESIEYKSDIKKYNLKSFLYTYREEFFVYPEKFELSIFPLNLAYSIVGNRNDITLLDLDSNTLYRKGDIVDDWSTTYDGTGRLTNIELTKNEKAGLYKLSCTVDCSSEGRSRILKTTCTGCKSETDPSAICFDDFKLSK